MVCWVLIFIKMLFGKLCLFGLLRWSEREREREMIRSIRSGLFFEFVVIVCFFKGMFCVVNRF